ncbi:hypothetical protein PR048_014815 [Dryococelus australis]|uniref:Uncharacterized protein n=1 Tax=Dryococelus australis TaxID=614101 RepID=A0ABQ9HF75_9NEOP|nr:hypothetical protein PR048_014815 [Dryococelus australis]
MDQVKSLLEKHCIAVAIPDVFIYKLSIKGKYYRQPFPLSKTKNIATCQIFHADICGPMESVSRNSKCFCNKPRDTGNEVKILRIGNNTELVSQEVTSVMENESGSNNVTRILENLGILYQKAVPYCTEQNSKMEH